MIRPVICYHPYPAPYYMWDTVKMQTQKVSKVPHLTVHIYEWSRSLCNHNTLKPTGPSYWQPSCSCLHWRLSFWQPGVQPVMKSSSMWWPFGFNAPQCKTVGIILEVYYSNWTGCINITINCMCIRMIMLNYIRVWISDVILLITQISLSIS